MSIDEALAFEDLESRRMLASGATNLAAVGTVYVDTDQSGTFTTGEGLAGVTIEVYEDDGNNAFNRNTDALIGTGITDSEGMYCIEGLDATSAYFVVQSAQVVQGIALPEQVSNAVQPGNINLLIDSFDQNQQAQASGIAPVSDGSTLTFVDEAIAIGAERDLFVELTDGIGDIQLRVDPFDSLDVLQINSTSGVEGRAVVTWDGQDFDSNPTPDLGLGGRDLTQGGVNTGFALDIGVDPSGAGETVTIAIYQGDASQVSTATATIPVTNGTATEFLFIPFTDFSGPVSPDDVDAIQLLWGSGEVSSTDGQIDVIGVVGPAVTDFQNTAEIDLEIVKSNTTDTIIPGTQINYDIVVTNNGPSDAIGATITDTFPTEILNVSYTSTGSDAGAEGHTSGDGNISDLVNLAAGSSITYSVTGTVDPSAVGTLTNTANVSEPSNLTETNPDNNEDDESDELTPVFDLSITKSTDPTMVRPGDTVTYTVTVSNAGPSDAIGATVTDVFPDGLIDVSYTSTSTGGATGATNGDGDISDLVNLPAGSSITYVAMGTVDNVNITTLTNTATITAPDGTSETNPDNNDGDADTTVTPGVDLAITKTNNVDALVPGETTTYEIVVQNLGPGDADGVVITDDFPDTFTNVSWTSTATGGAENNTAASTGDINETVNMPAGSTITYQVTGTVAASATGQLANIATVTAPSTTVETVTDNNTADDTDPLTPEVDLVVTKDDGVTSATPGQTLTYQIVVSNSGPSDATGVQLIDNFPSQLTNVSFTSVASNGASGNQSPGTGSLNETLNLPAGSSVTYEVTATVSASATSDIINTAQAVTPNGVTDTNPGNNEVTDQDTLDLNVDLSITKTNNLTEVSPGQAIAYQIVVSNNGPATATNAVVTDNFPSQLTGVTFTSTATNGATGHTNGSNLISDVVTMPAGSTITYNVTATLASNASGTLANTASVTAPANATELDTTNNSATDSDPIAIILAQLSGFVYVDSDDDGVFDPGEQPISGVTINLQQNGIIVGTTTTNANGFYQFVDLVPGTYDVFEQQPAAFLDGRDTAAGGIGTVVANDQFEVTLGPGDDAQQLNFGELTGRPSKRNLLASRF